LFHRIGSVLKLLFFEIKFLTSYGDIIKHTINQCKEISKLNTIKAISLTMQREFNELIMNQTNRLNESSERNLSKESIITHTPEFNQVKELAKKFLFLFSASDVATHEALVEFQKDGIDYVNDALEKEAVNKWQTLAFFDLICDVYASKLNTNDKRALIKYLNEKPLSLKAHKNLAVWQSYFNYRDSLIHVNENAQQKLVGQQQQQGDEELEDDEGDETVAEPQVEAKQAETPFQLTSTVLQSTRIDSNAKMATRKRTSLFTSNVSNIMTRKRKQDMSLNISEITMLLPEDVPKSDGPNSKIEIISKKTNTLSQNFNKITLNEKKRSRSPIDENAVTHSPIDEGDENCQNRTLTNDTDEPIGQSKRVKLSQTPKKVSIAIAD
jgi:hypothetical protein